MCNMQPPHATSCIAPKPKPDTHLWLLIGWGHDIWRWMSVNIGAHTESQPLPTHLSQCDSCVMIWGVWTAVCLASPHRRVLSWLIGSEQGDKTGGEGLLFSSWQLSASCAEMWEINKHRLLQRLKKVQAKILMNDGSSLNSLRKSAAAAKIRNHKESSYCDLCVWFHSWHH